MRVFAPLALSALLLSPNAALAEKAPKDAKAPKEKKVCRNTGETTTTRIGRTRVCKTAAEWAEERNGRDAVSTKDVKAD